VTKEVDDIEILNENGTKRRGRRPTWEMKPHPWILNRIRWKMKILGLKNVQALVRYLKKDSNIVGVTQNTVYRAMRGLGTNRTSALVDICRALEIHLADPWLRERWELAFLKFFSVDPNCAADLLAQVEQAAELRLLHHDQNIKILDPRELAKITPISVPRRNTTSVTRRKK